MSDEDSSTHSRLGLGHNMNVDTTSSGLNELTAKVVNLENELSSTQADLFKAQEEAKMYKDHYEASEKAYDELLTKSNIESSDVVMKSAGKEKPAGVPTKVAGVDLNKIDKMSVNDIMTAASAKNYAIPLDLMRSLHVRGSIESKQAKIKIMNNISMHISTSSPNRKSKTLKIHRVPGSSIASHHNFSVNTKDNFSQQEKSSSESRKRQRTTESTNNEHSETGKASDKSVEKHNNGSDTDEDDK